MGCLPSEVGGGCGIRTREGLHPTRFPSERHRPLGESSARKVTGISQARSNRTSVMCPELVIVPTRARQSPIGRAWRRRLVRTRADVSGE